ncbi:MAG: hypothetical protein ACJAS3_001208 [Roseivirga sp.]|jgi:hypothetical protein
MIKKLVLILLIIFSSLGCESDELNLSDLPDGTYTGYFNRAGPLIKTIQSEITISLKSGSFQGTSNVKNYPAICSGTYTVEGNQIEFTNSCFFTADFDWTYILNGSFKATISGNELILVKDYGDGVSDTYQVSLK